ncbi:hypothetical protein CJU89_3196 [Yarrowia sp. B02]|nr:hypothetical protein CJU89_3196 [Yarrowia sp. B02]
MGIKKLTSWLRPYRVSKPTHAFADGVMFIDGHSMAHVVARHGNRGAMYDWRAVSLTMENLMNRWIAEGWNIEMILFDGLTPKPKMGEISRRTRERIQEASRSNTLSLAAGCSNVCYATLVNKYPKVNCKISTEESDDIVASMVFNYAASHRDTTIYLLSSDSDFCAFDFPDNVVLVNPHQASRDRYDSISLAKQLREKTMLPPSAVAYAIKIGSEPSESTLTDPYYVKFATDQMKKLTAHSIATHKEYVADAGMMESYKLLGGDLKIDPAAHRVINGLRASNESYMMMPIMCEPPEAEFAFDAGRRWRSLAYEIIAQKAGGKDMFFNEIGRKHAERHEYKVPMTDGAREKNDGLEEYKYGTRESITREVKSWKTKEDLVNAIYDEVALTTPVGEGLLKYSPEIAKAQALTYLTEIVNSVGKRRREIFWSERGKPMSGTMLRMYNKFLTCVMSLRLLEAAGFQHPIKLELYDMDAARYRQIVTEVSSPTHKKIDVRKGSPPRKNGGKNYRSNRSRSTTPEAPKDKVDADALADQVSRVQIS